MQEEQNYGRPEYEGPRIAPGPVALDDREERNWSVLAHLSTFLNLFTGFLGPVAALVIWLVYRDRSPKVAFHAMQSMWFQVTGLIILGVGWAVTGLLTTILIGILLIPGMAVLSIAPFAYSAYAAYRVGRQEDYRYPLIADLVQGR